MLTSRSRTRAARARRFVALSAAAGVAVGAACLGAGPAQASSHREAPLIAGDPKLDNTDVYAFVSPDATDTVTLIANWIPFEEPNGGPNFYPFLGYAYYDINIDNNGDGKRDLIYRFRFKTDDHRGTDTFLYNDGPVSSLDDFNLLYKQTYTVERITPKGSKIVASGTAAPSNVGKASMPNYGALRSQAISDVSGGGKAFAGQSDDSFFLDLRVFDLLYGGNLSEVGTDTLKGYNVNSVALQLPKSALSLNGDATGNPVVGVWSSTSKRPLDIQTGKQVPGSKYKQVSRLGNPLVNELVIPAGLKNAFNTLLPTADATIPKVVQSVTEPELPKKIEAIYPSVKAPATPRNDLVEIYLTGIAKKAPTLDGSTAPIQADLNSQILNKDADAKKFRPSEMLRLNTSVPVTATPNRLGVIGGDLQGFPNGRRLTDDVVDISIQAVEGAAQTGKIVDALATGDKVDKNDHAFGTTFPYLALPNTASVNSAVSDNFATPLGGGDPTPGGRFGHPDVVQVGASLLASALLAGGLLLIGRRRRSGRPELSA